MPNNNYLIYKHTCTVTGKSYIGQTSNFERRLRDHLHPSSKCIAFKNAIQKYGWKMFTTKILVYNLSLDQANKREERLIQEHCTLSPNGYNLITGGTNRSPSLETRKRISKANKKRSARPPSRTGKINTEESNHKRSLSLIGKRLGWKRSAESRMKQSITNKQRNIRPPSRTGRVNSLESNYRRSLTQKGTPKCRRTTLFDRKEYNKKYHKEYYQNRRRRPSEDSTS